MLTDQQVENYIKSIILPALDKYNKQQLEQNALLNSIQSALITLQTAVGVSSAANTLITGITGELAIHPVVGTQSSHLTAQSKTTATIQYKDWSSVNQSVTVVTAVTLAANAVDTLTLEAAPLKGVTIDTNAFTKGIRTT